MKTCPICKTQYRRKHDEDKWHYKARKTCGNSHCIAVVGNLTRSANAKPKEPRHCVICGAEFFTDNRRKTCGEVCGEELRIKASGASNQGNRPASAYIVPERIMKANLARAEQLYSEYAARGITYGTST